VVTSWSLDAAPPKVNVHRLRHYRLNRVRQEMAKLDCGPGMSENQLWAVLHQAVIENDGDYVETRLLSSGPRTNPWMQEASPRIIEPSDLVGLDTDVVGPFGYYADFSRTFFCEPGL
jgi:Xaa-Pro aminopeptidase